MAQIVLNFLYIRKLKKFFEKIKGGKTMKKIPKKMLGRLGGEGVICLK